MWIPLYERRMRVRSLESLGLALIVAVVLAIVFGRPMLAQPPRAVKPSGFVAAGHLLLLLPPVRRTVGVGGVGGSAYEGPGARGGWTHNLPTSTEGTITFNTSTGNFDGTVMSTAWSLPGGTTFPVVNSGNATTNTSNANSAIASAMAARNAKVEFPTGIFNIDGQIILPAGSSGGTQWTYIANVPFLAGTQGATETTRINASTHSADLTTLNYTGTVTTGIIRSNDSTDVSYVRFAGIQITAPIASAFMTSTVGDFVRISQGIATTSANRPHHVIFDRCVLTGHATGQVRNGYLVACDFFALLYCNSDHIHATFGETHGLSWQNSRGPLKLVGNRFGGAGISYLCGGEGNLDQSTVAISGASTNVGSETQFVTATSHGLSVSQPVLIADHGVSVNGPRTVSTVVNATTFRIPVNGGSGTGGTALRVTNATNPPDTTAYLDDQEIRRNYFDSAPSKAQGMVTKNCLEAKYGRRGLITGNVFRGSWTSAQTGFGIIVQTSISGATMYNEVAGRTNYNANDWCIWYNRITEVAQGFQSTGITGNNAINPRTGNNYLVDQTQRTYNISICHNFWEIGTGAGAESNAGRLAILQDQNGTFEWVHNTARATFGGGFGGVTWALECQGIHSPLIACTDLTIEDNIWAVGGLGIKAGGIGQGTATLSARCTVSSVERNILFGSPGSSGSYPGSNQWPVDEAAVGYTNLAGGDYTLSTGSAYKGDALNGNDPGAHWARLSAAIGGVT